MGCFIHAPVLNLLFVPYIPPLSGALSALCLPQIFPLSARLLLSPFWRVKRRESDLLITLREGRTSLSLAAKSFFCSQNIVTTPSLRLRGFFNPGKRFLFKSFGLPLSARPSQYSISLADFPSEPCFARALLKFSFHVACFSPPLKIRIFRSVKPSMSLTSTPRIFLFSFRSARGPAVELSQTM